MEKFLITIQQLNSNIPIPGAKKNLSLVTLNYDYFFGSWQCLSFLWHMDGLKLSCLLVGIADGACGVFSVRCQ